MRRLLFDIFSSKILNHRNCDDKIHIATKMNTECTKVNRKSIVRTKVAMYTTNEATKQTSKRMIKKRDEYVKHSVNRMKAQIRNLKANIIANTITNTIPTKKAQSIT